MIPVSIKRKIMEINKTLYRLSKEISESELVNPLLIGIPRRGDLLAKRILAPYRIQRSACNDE